MENLHLPVADYRQEILKSVDTNQVTIITAETGAGKSTQVPQYLAEHGYKKIIVTQPRIIAARNLCYRVREEWCERFGQDQELTVGYRTSHEEDFSPDTTILYCTDGLQLVREVTGSGISERQVLIIDELHEWNQNMEVLVAWAKKRCQEELGFKVVIMSATIEALRLADYFKAGKPIEVPGRGFPITMRKGEDLVDEVHHHLATNTHNMLVFLPGKAEIEFVAGKIWDLAETKGVPIIPLHSQLEAEAQQMAFVSYPNGKIILSTNIAQTSVTIDDIDLVIDSGLERRIEIESGVEGLFISQVSKADCLQRAGRAGRTKEGTYVLCTFEHLDCPPIDLRSDFAVPEILRTHLDRLVLRLASAGIDIEDLEFFHTPGKEAIKHAKQTLCNLGAMTLDGEVTKIGERMERFPVESRYSRMLVEAEGLPDIVVNKLAAIIAIQEVGGIVKNGSRNQGWLQYTYQNISDLLAQYEVFIAIPSIDPDELEELGIIPKSVAKAKETFDRLCLDLGFNNLELTTIKEKEEKLLARCIVAGQLDQLWIIENSIVARPINGGMKREISGGTVLEKYGLVAGTPFNLEIATARGLEILYLVQDLTRVDPKWLVSMAPQLFKVQPDKVNFNSSQKKLTQRWKIQYKGKSLTGVETPLLSLTKENRRLYIKSYAEWLWGRLENDRRQLQKLQNKRIHSIPIYKVKERVTSILAGVSSFEDLDTRQIRALDNLLDIRTYIKSSDIEGHKHKKKIGGKSYRRKIRT